MQPIAQMLIELMPDGNVRVKGPIQDKTLCYGLLEQAKDAIRVFNPADQKKIVLPEPVFNGGT